MKYCMNEIIHSIIDLSYIVLEVLTVFVLKPFRPNLTDAPDILQIIHIGPPCKF